MSSVLNNVVSLHCKIKKLYNPYLSTYWQLQLKAIPTGFIEKINSYNCTSAKSVQITWLCYRLLPLVFQQTASDKLRYCTLTTLQDEFTDTFPKHLAFKILPGKPFPRHGKCILQKNVLANLQWQVTTWTISVSLLRSTRKLLRNFLNTTKILILYPCNVYA